MASFATGVNPFRQIWRNGEPTRCFRRVGERYVQTSTGDGWTLIGAGPVRPRAPPRKCSVDCLARGEVQPTLDRP